MASSIKKYVNPAKTIAGPSEHQFPAGTISKLARPEAEFFAALMIAAMRAKDEMGFVRAFGAATALRYVGGETDHATGRRIKHVSYYAKDVVDFAIKAGLVNELGGEIGPMRVKK